MTQLIIVPFTADHVSPAVSLLSAHHNDNHSQHPLLPKTFDSATALQNAFEKPRSQGVTIYNNGKLVGYLLDYKLHTPTFGRTAWLGLTGYALDVGVSIELYRDMYAVLAEMWVCDGYFDHYVMVPAGRRDLLDLWFALGFGMQQCYALLDLRTWENTAPVPDDVTVRLASPDDSEIVHSMADTIAQYQMRSPVFASTPPEVISESIRPGMVDLITDPECMLWLAEKNGNVVGYQGYAIE
ncbi:MAG: hypothetical protein AAF653_10520, partial [Chloroflexota bacterium]